MDLDEPLLLNLTVMHQDNNWVGIRLYITSSCAEKGNYFHSSPTPGLPYYSKFQTFQEKLPH